MEEKSLITGQLSSAEEDLCETTEAIEQWNCFTNNTAQDCNAFFSSVLKWIGKDPLQSIEIELGHKRSKTKCSLWPFVSKFQVFAGSISDFVKNGIK